MAIKLAVMNQKGGVLKSTLVNNLADYLKDKGRVLIVDLDQQDNQKHLIGLRTTDHDSSMAGILVKDFNPKEVVHSVRENVDIIPSGGKRIEKFNKDFEKTPGNDKILTQRMESIEEQYDYILIDSNPSFNLIHVNIINYSDFVISPSDMDMLSFASTRSTMRFIESLTKNEGIYLGVVPVKFDKRRNTDNLIMDQFYELYDNGLMGGGEIFHPIRESSKVKTSQTRRKFLSETYPNYPIYEDFQKVSEQILKLMETRKVAHHQIKKEANQEVVTH